MGRTKIQWTDMSWPVVTGCSHAGGPGCDNCYAARMAATRLKHHPRYEGLATIENGKARWTGEVRLNHDVLEQPLRWRKPRRVFVASMGDLFHPDVFFEFVLSIWRIMWQAKQHLFQVLTKHPDRMLDFLEHLAGDTRNGKPQLFKTVKVTGRLRLTPLLNVWLGTSIENQAAANERREHLRQCPAAVKFVSYEPTLGPVDWTGWEFVDQVISGGESGPGARPSHPDWHKVTRDFCQANGIAYFFKQWGEFAPESHWRDFSMAQRNRKGIVFSFKDRRFPQDQRMYKVGKKTAGRLLDGQMWDQFPVSIPRQS